MATISGEIYQITNGEASPTNLFPRTVTDAVYGLSSVLQNLKSDILSTVSLTRGTAITISSNTISVAGTLGSTISFDPASHTGVDPSNLVEWGTSTHAYATKLTVGVGGSSPVSKDLILATGYDALSTRITTLEGAADGEDIILNASNKLRFADRSAATGKKGYKTLRSNATLASQVADTDVIYEVRYAYDLNDGTVTIPSGSELRFIGGSISNGTIELNEGCVVCSDDMSVLDDVAIVLLGKNIIIERVKITSSVDAIRSNSTDVSGLRVRDCKIESVDNCVKLITDSFAGIVHDIVISGNAMRFYRMGVELQQHSGTVDYKFNGFIITDNYFVDLGNTTDSDTFSTFQSYCYAVSLSGYGENGIVSRNTFRAVNIGVEQVGYDRITISDNTFIKNATPFSFSNVRAMHDCVISANTVYGGLVRFTNIQDSIITGNNFTDIEHVNFTGSHGNKFIGNKVYALNTGDAVFFDNSGNNVVTNNSIYHDNASGQAIIKCYGSNSTNNIFDDNGLWRNSSIGTWWQELSDASGNKMLSWINLGNGNKSDSLVSSLSTTVSNNYTALAPINVGTDWTDVNLSFSHFKVAWQQNNSTPVLLLSFRCKSWVGYTFVIEGMIITGNNDVNTKRETFKLSFCAYNLSSAQGWVFDTSDSTNISFERIGETDGLYYINIVFKSFNENRGAHAFGHIYRSFSDTAQFKADRRAS